jgi:hypothetical protein
LNALNASVPAASIDENTLNGAGPLLEVITGVTQSALCEYPVIVNP